MPKGVRSPGKKQSNTKRAIKEFDKWNEEKYPVFNEAGKQLILKEDEVFVPAWDYSNRKKNKNGKYLVKAPHRRKYKEVSSGYILNDEEAWVVDPKFDLSYYVSNYGNVLSFKFHGEKKPLLMTHSPATGGYLQVGDDWRSHKLVWFSFMADAIKKTEANPEIELPYKNPLIYGTEVAELKDLRKLTNLIDAEVHHEDLDVTNNALENLEVLPKDVHEFLTEFQNTDIEKRWEKFRKSGSRHYYDGTDEATILLMEDEYMDKDEKPRAIIDHASQGEVWKHMTPDVQKKLLDEYWIELSKVVFSNTLNVVGKDFFMRDIYMALNVNNQWKYLIYKKKAKQHTAYFIENHSNIDWDIIYTDDNIYIPNYIFE